MLPVGSVIDIQHTKFVIAGYRPVEQDGSVSMGYLLVPYPLGVVNTDSFSLVAGDKDRPIVYEGYRDNDAEAFNNLLEQIRAFGRGVTMEELLAVADEAKVELETDLAAWEAEGA